jgi:hypothetical protein
LSIAFAPVIEERGFKLHRIVKLPRGQSDDAALDEL